MINPQKRYVGLDVHKHYVMVGAVNAYQEMVLPPRKVSLAEFEGWAKKHLRRPTMWSWKRPPMPGTCMTCWNRGWRGWWSAIRPRSN